MLVKFEVDRKRAIDHSSSFDPPICMRVMYTLIMNIAMPAAGTETHVV